MHFPKALYRYVSERFRLDLHGYHGCAHWARVRLNGLLLARAHGAHPGVVTHFALLHDACRQDEGRDLLHGPRAAQLAKKLRASIALDASDFEHLLQALEGHTGGKHPANIHIATCWDADRLDIGRVGVPPDPQRLFTPAARDPDTILQAYTRSMAWLQTFQARRGSRH